MTGGGVALRFLTSLSQALILLPPWPVGFQDPPVQPPLGGPQPGDSGISETRVDPFPLLQLEMRAGLALRCQLLGQLAPEGVAVETQTDVLLNS